MKQKKELPEFVWRLAWPIGLWIALTVAVSAVAIAIVNL